MQVDLGSDLRKGNGDRRGVDVSLCNWSRTTPNQAVQPPKSVRSKLINPSSQGQVVGDVSSTYRAMRKLQLLPQHTPPHNDTELSKTLHGVDNATMKLGRKMDVRELMPPFLSFLDCLLIDQ